MDIGCYSVNLSRMLFGGEPTRVQAARPCATPATGVDVLTSAILEFPAGVATFTCSIRSETDQRVHIYGTRGPDLDRHPVQHPAGPADARLGDRRRRAAGRARRSRCSTFETADPYARRGGAFAAAILDGTPPPVPPADAVANMRVIERIFAAARGRAGRA